ncbi:TPA: hypothetical protein L4623_005379 [Pseudomonas aeruginosa]|jgi:hypothetical protein|uniref:Uncharacterized protein n=3 Tax=root TaxID=1 RepID=A0A6H1Q8Y5_PSEAI|nr:MULTISPECIES: hypothetical protein [Pseudomonadaceae]MDP9214932.1 hypothetical protein [Pseudomonadota bacterium]QPN48169.1 hypothetical protein I5S86_28650 [Priestia aryabhattai]EGB97795.1 hypothetical protein G1E_16683 [Pseudomonas sp. TJI-51]EKK5028436.1 hypothetical protein [Pseudomonas aeruginosa]EKU5978155.1 hypothetical protein [Pseudomonas aeruginosa]
MLVVLRDSKMFRAVPRVILWGGVALFLFLILVLAEGSVYLGKVGEARDAAIAQWLNEHPEDGEAVARYRTVCIGSPGEPDVEKIASPPQPVLTFAECAEKVGSPDLMVIIQAAEYSIPVPILLSWLSRTLASVVLL